MTKRGFEIDQNVNERGEYFGYIDGWFVNYGRNGNALTFELEADYGDGKSENPVSRSKAEKIVAEVLGSIEESDIYKKILAALA